jgi:hypothetical protein
MKEYAKHGSSRGILLDDGKIVKFYPKLYGYIIHEIARIFFQIFHGVYRLDFISRKKRILNELSARKILNSIGFKTTEIISFSLQK